jgi:Brp/Blh family beta-carotene 15,15'-monooxygenase
MLGALRPYRFFLACCALACGAGWTLGATHPSVITGLCALILLAGLPHGAFDWYLLKHRYSPRHFAPAVGAYLGLVALTVLFWWLLPLIFLAAFLAYSAYHFGDSDWPASSQGQKIAWGTAIVSMPCLLNTDQVAELFATIIAVPDLVAFTTVVGLLGVPATLGCILLRHVPARNKAENSAGHWTKPTVCTLLLCYAVACSAGGPLAGFACYFACLHGPFHLTRWRQRVPGTGMAAVYGLTGVVLLVIAAAVLWLPIDDPSAVFGQAAAHLSDAALRYTFVALAALTVPHMTLLLLNQLDSDAQLTVSSA